MLYFSRSMGNSLTPEQTDTLECAFNAMTAGNAEAFKTHFQNLESARDDLTHIKVCCHEAPGRGAQAFSMGGTAGLRAAGGARARDRAGKAAALRAETACRTPYCALAALSSGLWRMSCASERTRRGNEQTLTTRNRWVLVEIGPH